MGLHFLVESFIVQGLLGWYWEVLIELC